MNFKNKATANTTIKYAKHIIPSILISEQAINEMYIYTKEVSDEVGWLGTVEQLTDGTYYIGKTFLFDQEVHGTTTEITPEGLSSFGEELLKQPDGVEIWNSLRMWGHSHVNMATNPSGQDDKQMEDFANIGHDYFIRLITNKSGSLRLDFYDYKAGLTFLDVPYGIEISVNPEVQKIDMQLGLIQEKMKQLENEMQLLINKDVTDMTPAIVAEIKTKVRKKVYSYGRGTGANYGYGQGRTGYTQGVQGTAGYWYNGVYYADEWDDVQTVSLEDLFSEKEIEKLTEVVTNRAQFEKLLTDMGYAGQIDHVDIGRMYSKLIQAKWRV